MGKTSRGPSMHDVAARAGVSHQTVSRVLNDFPGIRPATRERVLEAISALGYRRNLAARTLATGRSHTIGMIGPETPEIGPLSSLHSVEKAARDAGFHTLTTSTRPEPEQVAVALDFMLGRGIDALVLVAQHRSVQDSVASMIDGLPVVHLLTGGSPPGSSASVDQQAGVAAAMNHLFNLGHRRIQHVAGPQRYTEAQLRSEAYASHMIERGLARLPILEGDWTPDSGYEAGSRLDPSATAVFCANDQMALGLIHALSDTGRRIPEELSVVGFDDTQESRHSLPPLTTVHQDFQGVGELAIAVLVARMAGDEAPPNEPLVPWLVERRSTAPPPAG